MISACQREQHGRYQGYVEGENVYLASPISGNLDHMFVQRGARVKKGDLLFKLDDNPEILALHEAEQLLQQGESNLKDLILPRRPPEIDAVIAQIKQADAQITLAKLRFDRNTILYNQKVLELDAVDGSRATYVEALELKAQYESNLDLAKLGARDDQIKAQAAFVESLKFKLEQVKWQFDQKRLYAPSDGIIFETYYSKGEFVGEQKPIASLLPWDHIRIEFFVPVQALSHLRLGQAIEFEYAGCADVGHAQINYISPDVEYAPPLVYSRDNNDLLVFRIKAVIQNPQDFKPGQPIIATESYHDN